MELTITDLLEEIKNIQALREEYFKYNSCVSPKLEATLNKLYNELDKLETKALEGDIENLAKDILEGGARK